jgi:hypothetical protein
MWPVKGQGLLIRKLRDCGQCCQMVYFQTNNPNLGKFWQSLLWKILVFYGNLIYFATKRYILWPFGTFCVHLVYFSPFWYFGVRKIWQPRWWRHLSAKRGRPLRGHSQFADCKRLINGSV